MRNKLLYVLAGAGLGAGSHYAYRQYNPQRNVKASTMEMIKAYISRNQIQQGYIINVLKSVGLMLKGFYHYGLDTKIQGFNYNTTYIKKQQVRDQKKDIKSLYCIFSPTQYICGHPQIQHGGATATIIDQNMGYLAMLSSKEMVATVDLHIKYKRPVRKDQYYVLQAQVIKKQGRKLWLKAYIKQLQTGQLKVQSEGLFYTVKWDNQMSRILGTFFKVIDYKNFSQENHQHPNIHKLYQQANIESNQIVKPLNIVTHTQQKSQATQQRIHQIEQLIHKLQKKQHLIQIPPVETSKIYNEGRADQKN